MNTHKEIFSLVNSVDFVKNQKFWYKKTDLSRDFGIVAQTLVSSFLGERPLDNALLRYLKSEIDNADEATFKRALSKIRKHCIFGNKTDYRYLALAQAVKICALAGFEPTLDEELRKKLKFSKKDFARALNHTENPSEISNLKIKDSFKNYLDFIAAQEQYYAYKIVNIGVCATMSAGKSTLVNALLGHDWLPMRNEATTAKITSIYDNDALNKLVGYAVEKGQIARICGDLDKKTLDNWNDDESVERIVLQGDLDNIANAGGIVAVHDTPGTNNSGDTNHHDVTSEFFKSHKMDAILFVANATQLCTTDEAALLKELRQIVQENNTKVIFAINKADYIDTNKESFEDIVAGYSDFVEKIGFENPKIFLVSAKGARLFKMALKGKSEHFSESERDDFPIALKRFSRRIILDSGEAQFKFENESAEIDGEKYSVKEIATALAHTGLSKLEKELENVIKL